MATVYILYSQSVNKFYTGSCADLKQRLKEHAEKKYRVSYTAKADDWVLYYSIPDLEYKQARNIEAHIKKMKSRKYFQDLLTHPEITVSLINKYTPGADRF